MAENVTRITQEVNSANRDLRQRVEELLRGPDGEDAPAGGWTMKEMLGHIGFWREAAVPVITYMLRGREIPDGWQFGSGYVSDNGVEWPRDYVHNARESAWARDQTMDAVISRWDKAHAALLTVLETVNEEQAIAHAAYFADLAGELRGHLAQLPAGSR